MPSIDKTADPCVPGGMGTDPKRQVSFRDECAQRKAQVWEAFKLSACWWEAAHDTREERVSAETFAVPSVS